MRFWRFFSTRIFLGYFLVLGVAAYAALTYFSDAIKPAVRQTMEDMLVEEATLLAEMLSVSAERAAVVPSDFPRIFAGAAQRDSQAVIFGIRKGKSDQRVYVTDDRGIVLFDSAQQDVGKDFSRWHDVTRTLRGEYGARSSHVGSPPGPSILHVGAPIYLQGRIVGVVTVAKPVTGVDPFLRLARSKILRTGAFGLLLSLGVGFLFSLLLSRFISRLVRYAQRVAAGQREPAPALGGELGVLAGALESMRATLDGKKYVEHTVQIVAHEMKSPLTAIVGSAELLEEELPLLDRQRFASRVKTEALRLQQIIERLLELALVEQRRTLQNPALVSLSALVRAGLDHFHLALSAKSLITRLTVPATNNDAVWGEEFLLQQAFRNLLENALAFAPPSSTLAITLSEFSDSFQLTLHNLGPAIPPFAQGRLFERFYSVPHPETGRRSSGLGLAFVREVSELHHATITVENGETGVVATWTFPKQKPKTSAS